MFWILSVGVIRSLAVFLDGLLAGVFLASAMVEHGMRKAGGPVWLEYKQAKEVVFGSVMPSFMLATILASLLGAIAGPGHARFAVTTALLVAALALTVVVHLPLNKAFTTWPTNDPPAAWPKARRRWQTWNWVRTALVVAAFAAALAE